MTFTVRLRGDSSSLVTREYDCPHHGRFDQLERRDEDWEYRACPDPTCAALSPFVLSAPLAKMAKVYAVTRGSDNERHPGQLDTRALADGMPQHLWAAEQDKASLDRRRKKLKGLL